jgi:hypothetical protein
MFMVKAQYAAMVFDRRRSVAALAVQSIGGFLPLLKAVATVRTLKSITVNS